MFIEWTQTGQFHMDHKKGNEDALLHLSKNGFRILALCDGVSSCEHSGEGARLACESLGNFFLYKGNKLIDYERPVIAEKTVSHVLFDLNKHANKAGISLESLSSTAACVVYVEKKKMILCLNIGDSLIGGICHDGIKILAPPSKNSGGTYVTTTKGVEKVTVVTTFRATDYKSVFICSDGMWKQFYKKGCINEDASEYFNREDYAGLISLLQREACFDDRSLIAMNLEQ